MVIRRLLFLLTLICMYQQGYTATIVQNKFVGISNISDPDISCVSGSAIFEPSKQWCWTRTRFSISSGNGSLGFWFNRFDTSLGTLNSVSFTYYLETGGVWIARPENSIFSDSTDFRFRSLVGLYADHFGDKDNVNSRRPTWDGISNINTTSPNRQPSDSDIIDGGETFAKFNLRVSPETRIWRMVLSGTKEYAVGPEFLFDPDSDPGYLFSNIQLLLIYELNASLVGQDLDCGLGNAPCGATNRITYLRKARLTLTYDYDPPAVVPVPAAVWLFGSALGMLGWMRP